MSLPPGFLDELRTRTSLVQVVGRKVMWDPRKSNQGKGDMWAPCPFHQEKTASFHVDDRKGFYHCFGCHASGDAISFVRETENVDFIEAVEILAQEAGMQMPARDPKAQEKQDHRTEIAKVMEQAVQFFRLQLKTGAAEGARGYLERRGLTLQAQERWDIGYSPDNRQALFQHLTGKGVAPELIVDAGLCAKPDDGGAPYDRFRGRIIFPIRDPRGRAIALGGRALDPNARAKYLNSPETLLFDKGRSLYNHGPAREAAGKGKPLIVAEGYMDVIALSEAGFGATVAPLGTAITEDQLRLLWRVAPEPIIALDGDTAGLRAAMRVIDLALPMLEAGQSLRFAIMPEGKDPDDVLKSDGPDAMQRLLDGAMPMVNLLWQRETEGKNFDSPERKAALDKSLRETVKKIRDPSIRRHYADDLNRMRHALFGPVPAGAPAPSESFDRKPSFGGGKWQGGRKNWRNTGPSVQPTTKTSLLATGSDEATIYLRECVVLATLLRNPGLIERFETPLERYDFSTETHNLIRDVLLRVDPASDVESALLDAIGPEALENLTAPRHVQLAPGVRSPSQSELAELCVEEEMRKLMASYGAEREISEAMRDMEGAVDEGMTWRLSQAAEARNKASRSEGEDKAAYDIAENGTKMNREERSAFDGLLAKIQGSRQKAKR
ncbi:MULTISPECIES: DNA primase [Halocynthiibacter]|uniref:DNA primase n=1 Tax=Halocynthiibacter halioticoli TaxID=2986804 RepID=A0AAE3J3P5_9RHOB|nr:MULTISPECIES: DNA primase [Halocynthiibacter]MCV6824942.1 DNA primase [Halocynthiibacter halioticoli]MCW4057943.1 DNA primase [Halocynthiibacter sp. SDUM655004]